MICLIVGDFCVGKDLVADYMVQSCNDMFDITARKVKSYTTRLPRYEGEDTHEFCTREEFEDFDDLLATTVIGDEYYGARLCQFDPDFLNVYVVDSNGVKDMLASDVNDPIYVVQIIRPSWLNDCPKSRTERHRESESEYKFDYRIINDGDKNSVLVKTIECLKVMLPILENSRQFN